MKKIKSKRAILLILSIFMVTFFIFSLVACTDTSNNDKDNGNGNGNINQKVDDYYIVSCEIITNPTKENYSVGESFDPTGMVMKVVWNDGYEEEVSDGLRCRFLPSGALPEGATSVTIIYDTFTFTYDINRLGIESFEIRKLPVTKYLVGEKFSVNGLVVDAILDDDSIVSDFRNYKVIDADKELAITDNKVQIIAEGVTKDIPIKVYENGAVMEAENAVIVNGEIAGGAGANTALANYASNSSFVRNFKAGGTITFNVNSENGGTADIMFSASSGYNISTPDDNGKIGMLESGDIQVNKVLTLTVNGVSVPISDDVMLYGRKSTTGADDVTIFTNWTNAIFDNITLNKAQNSIVFTSKVAMTGSTSIFFDVFKIFGDVKSIGGETGGETGGDISEDSKTIKFEAEKSIHTGVAAGAGYANSGIASAFSGGAFVKGLNSKTMTFTFDVAVEGEYSISLFGSSSYNSGKSDMLASVLISSVNIDGTAITLPDGSKFTGGTSDDAATNFKNITEMLFGSKTLTVGQHSIVITFANYGETYNDGNGNANDPFVDYLLLTLNEQGA